MKNRPTYLHDLTGGSLATLEPTPSGFNSFGHKVPESRLDKTRKFIKETIGVDNDELIEAILDKFKTAVENDMTSLVIEHSRSLETHSPLKSLDETSRYMILSTICTD